MVILDNPTLDDCLNWETEIARLQQRILSCDTPHVLGIHGDWGAGKTSFMRQLQAALGGEAAQGDALEGRQPAQDSPENQDAQKLAKEMRQKVCTIWFDAWRYQNESTPILALLQEMRAQFNWRIELAQKLKKGGKLALDIAVRSVLDNFLKGITLGNISLESVEKRAEKQEAQGISSALTTNAIRKHLQESIDFLLQVLSGKGDARVVVFIDDLDRCNPKAAMRLLEGLKIYLSLKNCVFVLGMNEGVLTEAISEEFASMKSASAQECSLKAAHYLEKIGTDLFRLPLPASNLQLFCDMLRKLEKLQSTAGTPPSQAAEDDQVMARLAPWLAALDSANQNQPHEVSGCLDRALPPNPRRLKALANQWHRFAACEHFPQQDAEGMAEEKRRLWAVRLLIAAYVHQFNRDIWERWRFDPDFWTDLHNFCLGNGPTLSSDEKKQHWSGVLQLPYTPSNASTDSTARPNPGDQTVFWIAHLIQTYGANLRANEFQFLLQGRKNPGVL